MINVEIFINELMSSNCFMVWDDDSRHCVIIDPASEKAEREIQLIEDKSLTLDYIFLTHEHTDHTWGVNALVEKFDSKVVCSAVCKAALPAVGNMYFRLYYDDPNYSYSVCRVDFTIEDLHNKLEWYGHTIQFIPSPGHSAGSICIKLDDMVFSGDTLMQYKPYVNKKSGSMTVYKQTIDYLLVTLSPCCLIYPGHGEPFIMQEYKAFNA